MKRWLAGLLGLAMLATLGTLMGPGYAQGPTPPGASVPDWVVKYANGQEAGRRACEVTLAQEQDKIDKLTKDLADAKSALAKAHPAKEPEKK